MWFCCLLQVHHNTNDTGGDEDYADNWTSSTPVLLQIQAARNYLYWLANHESDNNTSWKYNHKSHSMPAADAAAGSQCKTCIFPPHALNPCLSPVLLYFQKSFFSFPFSKVLIHDVHAKISVAQEDDNRSNGRQQYSSLSVTSDCTVVDGTTCQYSSCAKGTGLAACAIGYASGVTGGGGSHGKSYVVVSDEDNVKNPPQGSLRYGVNLGGGSSSSSSSGSGAGGVWITFARDMIIVLKDMLWIRSATTIDGRGYNVTITSTAATIAA